MMNFQSVRGKLRRLKSKTLFEVAMNQKEYKCILNGFCSFHFMYEGYAFCISEVLGKGCEIQKLENLEKEICLSEEELHPSLALFKFNDH